LTEERERVHEYARNVVRSGDLESSCWENYTDTAANGVTLIPYYHTIDACLHGCRHSVPGCMAVQWHRATNHCFAVFTVNAIHGRFPSPGIDLYQLTYGCLSTGMSDDDYG